LKRREVNLMDFKTFGRTGRRVSEIGIGTYYDTPWMFWALLGWKREARSKVEAVKAGLDGGINLIDTAEAYNSEGFVGDAVNGLKREDLFIATKVTPTHLGRESMPKALERSLKRLRTPYIDLYQIHYPRPFMSIADMMNPMEELLDQGKIRGIGVSNFSLKQMINANSSLRKVKVAAIQMEYSLVHRDIEKDILPYCRENGIAVLAYRPLGHGKLAMEQSRLKKLCEKYSKTPAQIALKWLASQPDVFPIPRASNVLHVKENLDASGWQMDEDDLRDLDRLYPPPP
jgi:diketogulonate reductase-like aldo/keto reductase